MLKIVCSENHPPDAKKLWPFTRRRRLGFLSETAYVVDGEHGGGDKPRRSQKSAYGDLERDDEKIQVIAISFLDHKKKHGNFIRSKDFVEI